MALEYDPSNYLESKGHILEFYQAFSGATVSFKAFLENYSETFNCQWHPQQVFGRPDPIQTYQGTSRSLNLAWKVPAYSLGDAENNLIKTSTLARMLYPEYSAVDNATTISKGPLIKIKFANLLFDASRGPGGDVRTSGLLGVIKSYNWSPDIDTGFFDPANELYPKLIKLTITFDVLHQHTLGWEKAEAVAANTKRRDRAATAGDFQAVTSEQQKLNKINDRRQDFAENAAPSWGADASMFPWSMGVQGSGEMIGNMDTGGMIQLSAQKDVLGD
jgi:hypothetical protein